MRKNDYIVLLDPSIQNNEGAPSDNLGDLVIYDSIKTILDELFPHQEITRISTHVYFAKKEKDIINNSRFTFVGGTNILTSDIRNFPRLTPVKKKGFYFFPGIKKLILLGTGWSSYQRGMDWASKIYYKKILEKNISHSVRDTYTLKKLNEEGFKNVLHTSCPSTWKLDTSFINKFDQALNTMLFMLTSYYRDESADNRLLEIILNTNVEKIYFFPQTKADTAYLSGLTTYKKNFSRFILLNHNKKELDNLISSTDINYIGNRLHGGIKCLSYNRPSMIVSVDNRASEMGNSINLNIIERNDITRLQKWINNEYIPPQVFLPLENIKHWKNQFLVN